MPNALIRERSRALLIFYILVAAPCICALRLASRYRDRDRV
jgi:hypothetical protein